MCILQWTSKHVHWQSLQTHLAATWGCLFYCHPNRLPCRVEIFISFFLKFPYSFEQVLTVDLIMLTIGVVFFKKTWSCFSCYFQLFSVLILHWLLLQSKRLWQLIVHLNKQTNSPWLLGARKLCNLRVRASITNLQYIWIFNEMSEEWWVYWGIRLWIKEIYVLIVPLFIHLVGVYVKVDKDINFPIPFKLLFLL